MAFIRTIVEQLAFVDESLSATLTPGDQTRGWRRRWEEAQRELGELLRPHHEELRAETINAARHRVHAFFITTYHIKDALKEEAGATGVAPSVVEDAISRNPTLALLADLANLDKHGTLSKAPRSGAVPVIKEASGTTGNDGWTLELRIEHAGRKVDGLQLARDVIAAWRSVLTGWGLI